MKPPSELLEFLLTINTAVTSIMVAYSFHLLLFCGFALGGITYCLYRKTAIRGLKVIAPIVMAILLGITVYSISPRNAYKYWQGGATSIRAVNPETKLDRVSEQVIFDLYTIYREHTTYDNSTTPILTQQGQRALEGKIQEYVSIVNDAKNLRVSFPAFYFSICAFLITACGFIIISYITHIPQYLYTIPTSLYAIAGYILFDYPVHYYILGEPMHIFGLLAIILCVVSIINDLKSLKFFSR